MPPKNSLIRVGTFVLTAFCFSHCSSSEEKRYFDQVKQLSESKISPQEQIKKADSLISSTQSFTVPKESLYQLYAIKQEAFTRLNDIESATEENKKALQLAESLQDSTYIAQLLPFYLSKSINENAFRATQRFFPNILSHAEDDSQTGKLQLLYANHLYVTARFVEANELLQKAQKIFEEEQDQQSLIRTYIATGNNFAGIEEFKKSNEYYHKAIVLAKKTNDLPLVASGYMNLGINFRATNPDSAIFYYQKTLSLADSTKETSLKIKTLYNLANVYFAQKKIDESKRVYLQILDFAEKNNSPEGYIMASSALGAVYNGEKKYEQSLALVQRAIEKADSNKLMEISRRLLPMSIGIYINKNDYVSALKQSEKLRSLNDSLLSIQKQEAILELEKKFQTQKKEIDNQNLREINTFRGYIIGLLLLSISVIVYLFYQRSHLYKERQSAYQILVQKYKNEAEARAKERETPTSNQGQESSSNQLLFYFIQKKPYLSPDLTPHEVANALLITQPQLEQEIKAKGYADFVHFINKHRIEEARTLFDNPVFNNLSMDEVSSKVGFKQKQDFQNAFEFFTGLKPEYYRNQVNNLN
ncbi:MAG: tetratricopeptide repeat protein [Spirosomataceae bacterium]